MHKKQIVVIVIVVAIMGFLYTRDLVGVKKAADTDGHTNTTAQQARPVVNVTVEMASQAAKMAIGPALAQQIAKSEIQLKAAGDDAAKLSLEKKLAQQWDDVNQVAPAAFYYEAVAEKENTFSDWETAGDHFNDAFRFDQDTASQPAFATHAVACFEKAAKMQPANLDAKTGLGTAYVNEFTTGIGQTAGGPPKGVTMLLEVVGQDPNNVKANFSLCMFAITSRQYDKAVLRFKTVIEHTPKPGFEPYFYLAECYRQLGMKPEAITAYQKSRALMPDTAIDKTIDGYIKELKN
jgi:tetratricopeptide (TPR) repeat protein